MQAFILATTTVILTATTLQLILNVVIPIITGLLTKITLPDWIKGVITLALNAGAAVIANNMADNGTAVLSTAVLLQTLIGFVISVAMYVGIYSRAGLTSSSPDGKLAPTMGIGPAVTHVD